MNTSNPTPATPANTPSSAHPAAPATPAHPAHPTTPTTPTTPATPATPAVPAHPAHPAATPVTPAAACATPNNPIKPADSTCSTSTAHAATGTCNGNTARDLTKQAPHSPRERLAGFVIAHRAIDKCRSTLAGKAGEYHFDCPLDNLLFTFKGITGAQFQAAVKAAPNDEAVGVWLLANGTVKTTAEIKTWSDQTEASSMSKNPEKKEYFAAECTRLGLKPESASTFDWLEADDKASLKCCAA